MSNEKPQDVSEELPEDNSGRPDPDRDKNVTYFVKNLSSNDSVRSDNKASDQNDTEESEETSKS